MKNYTFFFTVIFLLIFIIASLSPASAENGNGVVSINSYLGNYKVRFTGKVGGPYEPSGSMITGTTTGIIPFSLAGNITLSESEPGVIAVPEGTAIPGIDPEDIIFGAAIMQNPVQVFMGTEEATRPGDFGLFSMMTFGIPAGEIDLETDDCEGNGVFSCPPVFFKIYPSSGESVNLIYFVIQVRFSPDSVAISGTLYDRHSAEAAAANLFTVPVESPILGTFNDIFVLNTLTGYELVIKGNAIHGRINGAGYSAAGIAPQEAILEVEFEGSKENNTGAERKIDNNTIRVFPNPSSEKFIIETNSQIENCSGEIYSVVSGKLFSINITSVPFEINMGNRAPGIYLLRIFNGESSVLKKLIVQ